MVLVAATFATGCDQLPAHASASTVASSTRPAPDQVSAVAHGRVGTSSPRLTLVAVESSPDARPSSPSASPAKAFVTGYEAYSKGDYATAVAQLGYAAKHFPVLADYALFYLGKAQLSHGNYAAAVSNFKQLLSLYPQSVKVPQAQVALAESCLKLGNASEASEVASKALGIFHSAAIRQPARMTLARALLAMGQSKAAYVELMLLRQHYPHGPFDAEARKLAYQILSKDPSVTATHTVDYHLEEAQLLLSEGQPHTALAQVHEGLRLSPSNWARARLVFFEAEALGFFDSKRAAVAYREYLRLAPRGDSAPRAIEQLALIYWNQNRMDEAREMFGRLVMDFPRSPQAPGAMLRIGRILEEQKDFDRARAEYLRILQRYPAGAPAEQARFRAPWMYYMTGHYELAASSFGVMADKARNDAERDKFLYWRARAFEKLGLKSRARRIFRHLAKSLHSNYYPALAAMRVKAPRPFLPASAVSLPKLHPVPKVSGVAEFHLTRALALQKLGLNTLAPNELSALETDAGHKADVGRFVLAAYEASGAYHDAIVAASRMERRGMLDPDVAERIRYPRGYRDLIRAEARKRGLDPDLMFALIRQESLFDPSATSVSNARGLMQLLPRTARGVADRSHDRDALNNLNLFDPNLNVRLGTAYFRKLLTMFHGDDIKAVAAYNAGDNAVKQWLSQFPGSDDEWVENITYLETRRYVKQVIGGRREYRLLYGSGATHSASRPTRHLPG